MSVAIGCDGKCEERETRKSEEHKNDGEVIALILSLFP